MTKVAKVTAKDLPLPPTPLAASDEPEGAERGCLAGPNAGPPFSIRTLQAGQRSGGREPEPMSALHLLHFQRISRR